MTDLKAIAGFFPGSELIMKNAPGAEYVFACCPLRRDAPEGMLQTGLLSQYAGGGFHGVFALVRDCAAQLDPNDCAVLLPPETDPDALAARLGELFSHEAKLTREMEQLRSVGLLGSMQEVIDICSSVVGSEAALYDSLGRLMVFCGSPPPQELPQLPLCGVSSFEFEGAGICTASARSGNEFEELCLHIELDDETVGYLLFFGRFTPYARPYCEFLPVISAVIKAALRRLENLQPGRKFSSELFLLQLIGGEKMSRAALSSRAEMAGLEITGYFALLLVDLSRHPLEKPRFIPIVNAVERESGAYPLINGSLMTLFFQLDAPEQLQARTAEAWEHLRGLGYQGVCSRVFTELDSAAVMYGRTKQALELLAREESPGRLASFDELETDFVVSLCAMSSPSELHPAVVRLLMMDERGKFSYSETLYSFLLHSQRLTETCDALGIHRNTLDYRLRRIEESTGLDFGNGREMFSVFLSLTAARAFQASPKSTSTMP